mmetsp:Transcript_44380/g.119502  ORF Transcript_44380/g.119502 Transcript_44380/m.119502 type:complete len:117 (-) Transcript_44380:445-795(-)
MTAGGVRVARVGGAATLCVVAPSAMLCAGACSSAGPKGASGGGAAPPTKDAEGRSPQAPGAGAGAPTRGAEAVAVPPGLTAGQSGHAGPARPPLGRGAGCGAECAYLAHMGPTPGL